MPRRRHAGSLTVITGSMFAGKTEELIRMVRRAIHARKRVQVFKHAFDTRCETTIIRTHDGYQFEAAAVPDTASMAAAIDPDVDLVGVEEIQFFDESIVDLCQSLANRGVTVIVAGLDQDFRGMPFSFMPRLLSLAEHVLKLRAICVRCGGEASRTQRLIDGRPASWHEPTILVGAAETYEARCRACHEVRDIPVEYRKPMPASRNGASGSKRRSGKPQSPGVDNPLLLE